MMQNSVGFNCDLSQKFCDGGILNKYHLLRMNAMRLFTMQLMHYQYQVQTQFHLLLIGAFSIKTKSTEITDISPTKYLQPA